MDIFWNYTVPILPTQEGLEFPEGWGDLRKKSLPWGEVWLFSGISNECFFIILRCIVGLEMLTNLRLTNCGGPCWIIR